MKGTIILVAILILGNLTVSAQGDLSTDRDFQNFKRNYQKASNGFDNIEDCKTDRCKKNVEKYTKYSRKFLNKLIEKYGKANFTDELSKIDEIEAYYSAENTKTKSSDDNFVYVGLWIHRLQPNMLNNLVAEKNLLEFDRVTLIRAFENVKYTERFRKRYDVEKVKNFEMALSDFESYLQITKVFDQHKGLIGSNLRLSKTIQDKSYFVITLAIAQRITKALLNISPRSSSLNSKLQEIELLLKNADAETIKNKPKMVKKYKDTIPKATVKDSNLEQQFVNAIRYQKFPGVTITGAIITSPNWVITRSSDLRTVYRWRDGVVLAKTSEGDCWFQNFTFKQFYTGNGYGNAQRSSSGERFYIKCSELK